MSSQLSLVAAIVLLVALTAGFGATYVEQHARATMGAESTSPIVARHRS